MMQQTPVIFNKAVVCWTSVKTAVLIMMEVFVVCMSLIVCDVCPCASARHCDSLEGEGAPVEFLSGAKPSFFRWRTAQQQELMRRVHELQLLYTEKNTEVKMNNDKLLKGKLYKCSSYPTEWQLHNMRPVTGYNPAERDTVSAINQQGAQNTFTVVKCLVCLLLTYHCSNG